MLTVLTNALCSFQLKTRGCCWFVLCMYYVLKRGIQIVFRKISGCNGRVIDGAVALM